MPGLNWSYLAADVVLGFGVRILMALMVVSLAVWFACSIVQNVIKVSRRIRRPKHDSLLRENERLRDSLADAQQENDYLRKLYRNDLPAHAEDSRRNAA
jgi:cell division protein FtsB